MAARQQSVIAKARSRLERGLEKLLFMAVCRRARLSYITSETSCREAVSFPYKTISNLATVWAAV